MKSSEEVAFSFDKLFAHDVKPMTEEKSVGEKWVEPAERAGQLESNAGMVSIGSVVDLVTKAVNQEVALERQRCASCAQYEIDAEEFRASKTITLCSYAEHKQGAAVAKWIKKAILRGDTKNEFKGE